MRGSIYTPMNSMLTDTSNANNSNRMLFKRSTTDIDFLTYKPPARPRTSAIARKRPQMQCSNVPRDMNRGGALTEWTQRPSSAQGNLQSHPCFQSSLLDDGHAPGTVEEWRKNLATNRPQVGMVNIDRNADDYDQNLEVKAYFQSFKHQRRLTIANATSIQQYEVILLKRAKSYALVGLKGELKPKKDDSSGRKIQLSKELEEPVDVDDKKHLAIEERLDINALETLKRAFTQSSVIDDFDVEGLGQMTLEDFTRVVRKCLGARRAIDEQIEHLFNKIDYNAEQVITWDELCTFLQLNFDEKADADQRVKEISFVLPAKIQKTPHRYPCSTIVLSADHQYLALGSDGTISVWSPTGELKATKSVAATAGIDQTLTSRERLEKRKDQQTRSQPKWITDCRVIPEFSKVVVSTGDRELQFWDQTYCLSASREVKSNDLPCTQICSLDSVPIKLNYGITSPDELILIYGDTDGCVNILIFLAAREIFRLLTTVERRKGIPTVSFDRFLDSYKCDYIRWQVHREWIESISYDLRLNQIISCSNDQHTAVVIGCVRGSTSSEIQLTDNNTIAETKNIARTKSADVRMLGRKRRSTISTDANDDGSLPAVVIGRHSKRDSTTSFLTHSSSQDTASKKAAGIDPTTSRTFVRHHPIIRAAQVRSETDQTIFKIHKGVKTFDLSIAKNVLVTGGMDRVLRIWNPYVPSRPIARLRGHNAPVFLVKIAVEDDRLFSISTDKSVLVWDLIEHTLLACVRPKVHKIRGDLQAACYNPHTRCLLFASEQISFLNLKLRPFLHADVVVSHYEPILGLLFIKEFKQVISCTEGGVIRLWDFLTGRQVHEFRTQDGQAVTCMVLDTTERRLITGGRDGTCSVWNVHNGQLLKTFKTPRDSLEITDVAFVVVNNNCSILTVGWDKHVNVYKDDRELIKQVCFPEDRFGGDDPNDGHQEDILCIDKSQGDLIATGDYGGTIIIWNMSSKKIFAWLRTTTDKINPEENPNDRVVSRVSFIHSRFGRRDVANLIAGGPYGRIHFWNIYKNGVLMAKFRPNKDTRTTVTQVKLDLECRFLFAADSLGFIFIYEITNYALKSEIEPPRCLRTWRAHVDSVTGLEYIDPTQVIISCSLDWTIRLWNLQGHFMGTFGQSIPWNLYDPATYQHPSAPLDVLTDPRSLPRSQQSKDDEQKSTSPSVINSAVSSHRQTVADDETIANNVRDTIEKLRHSQSLALPGKRLRYFREKPTVSLRRDGSSHYQQLRFFPIDDNPPTATNQNVHFANVIKL